MKKILSFILVMLLLSACGATSNENEEGGEQEMDTETETQAGVRDMSAEVDEAEEEPKDEPEEKGERNTPPERTIDTLGRSPTSIDPVIANKWIEDGEKVFLLEDGEDIEKSIEWAAENIDLITESTSYELDIEVFSKDILKDHPDKEEYIEKLREANKALENEGNKEIGDRDAEATLSALKEAKTLREQ